MPRPVANPPDPWSRTRTEYLGEAPPARLEVFEERAKSIVSENTSPDIPFRYSVNPYRGCIHACAYCYARPSHQYLGFGAGTDFDRKIVVKVNAPDLLRRAFDRASWTGERINFSGNTDCYQALEASYELTRGCLEACRDYRNPVGILTKSALIQRDIDLLCDLHARADVHVGVSIAFSDEATARAIEPYAATVARRFETVERLARAGIPVSVSLAPIIPGLNDAMIPAILSRAKECGAQTAWMSLLRLPAEVMPVWDSRIAEAFPDRAQKITNGLVELRGPSRRTSAFGDRMEGKGERWSAIRQLFELQCKRLGLVADPAREPAKSTFARVERQGRLF